MAIGGVGLFQALADKMRWHQARQTVLAENVANADTPGYGARDLKEFSFGDQLHSIASVSTSITNPLHISVSSGNGAGGFDSSGAPAFEITPSGNGVSVEDEMMKVASNDMDYQTVTALYTRSMRLIRTAIGH